MGRGRKRLLAALLCVIFVGDGNYTGRIQRFGKAAGTGRADACVGNSGAGGASDKTGNSRAGRTANRAGGTAD